MCAHYKIILALWKKLGKNENTQYRIKISQHALPWASLHFTHILLCFGSYLELYPVNKFLKQDLKVFNKKVLNLKFLIPV